MRKRRSTASRIPPAGAELPIAVSPSGRRIGPEGRLPDLPLPKKVVVGRDALWVDGWVFRIFPIGRKTLSWFAYQVGAWCRKDPSPENKAQIMGVVEAVETLVKKGPNGGSSKQGEFKF
ncbi:MAG: hypothetical protein WCH98_05710 [Verrucomicrobiota bacterium]